MKSKFYKMIINSDFRFSFLSAHGLLNWMDDKTWLKRMFRIRIGYNLDLENPKTFNEKIQWLKLYDHQPKYIDMVDKYIVKKYVGDLIGKQYVIPTLGVWDRFEDIEFDKLPNKFVLKCTHDSGGIVICNDKSSFVRLEAKKKINRCLRRNFYWVGREWPYKYVSPKIIAEPYLHNDGEDELVDYKMMCFNGVVKCIFTCSERYSDSGLKVTFFDEHWNLLPFERHYHRSEVPIQKPSTFEQMKKMAERISSDIPFARVDFYEVNKNPLFGEITLYPGGGFEEFNPPGWDSEIGNWIHL